MSQITLTGGGKSSAGGSANAARSLLFDGNDRVDCGTDSSVVALNLLESGFTVDVYFRCPSLGSVADGIGYPLIEQGVVNGGWMLDLQYGYGESKGVDTAMWLTAGDSGFSMPCPVVAGQWYYVRVRKSAEAELFMSIDAGIEGGPVEMELNGEATGHLLLGGSDYFLSDWIGGMCYVHLWNIDKGILSAVPSTPLAVDANTAGRWIHSDGSGATLADTSGNANHGAITGAAWSPDVPAGWTI